MFDLSHSYGYIEPFTFPPSGLQNQATDARLGIHLRLGLVAVVL